MKRRWTIAALAMAALMTAPTPSRAQSPMVIGQLDGLGRFAGDAPFCEALGYTPRDPDGTRLAREIARIADRVGIGARDAEAAVTAARTKETQTVQASRDAALAKLPDPANDPALRAYAMELSAKCRRAADDPSASVLLAPPTGGVDAIARRFVDKQLAPFGRAGWQSPYVLAAGDLAQAVGACETRLGRARAQGYLAEFYQPYQFPPDVEETIRSYLTDRRAVGRKSPMSAAQCPQALAKRKALATKANPYR